MPYVAAHFADLQTTNSAVAAVMPGMTVPVGGAGDWEFRFSSYLFGINGDGGIGVDLFARLNGANACERFLQSSAVAPFGPPSFTLELSHVFVGLVAGDVLDLTWAFPGAGGLGFDTGGIGVADRDLLIAQLNVAGPPGPAGPVGPPGATGATGPPGRDVDPVVAFVAGAAGAALVGGGGGG